MSAIRRPGGVWLVGIVLTVVGCVLAIVVSTALGGASLDALPESAAVVPVEPFDPARPPSVRLAAFADVLDGDTNLLPVLGNHDVEGADDGDAQVAAFGMPGPWYATRIGDVQVVSLDSNRADDPEQIRWLRQTLADSTATWTAWCSIRSA